MSSSQLVKPGATLTEYCTAGKFLSEKQPMIHNRRTIDSFVVIYGVSGTVHLYSSGKNYDVSPDDYIILPALREHYGTEESPPGISYYWCHFYIHGDYNISEGDDGKEYLIFGENSLFRIPLFGKVDQHEKMHLLFHQLIDSSRSPSPLSKTICGNFLEIILSELAFRSCIVPIMLQYLFREYIREILVDMVQKFSYTDSGIGNGALKPWAH
jgi:hypothetical protein